MYDSVSIGLCDFAIGCFCIAQDSSHVFNRGLNLTCCGCLCPVINKKDNINSTNGWIWWALSADTKMYLLQCTFVYYVILVKCSTMGWIYAVGGNNRIVLFVQLMVEFGTCFVVAERCLLWCILCKNVAIHSIIGCVKIYFQPTNNRKQRTIQP